MAKLDGIHFNSRAIDGANKPINMVISARQDGKTTSIIVNKSAPAFEARGAMTIAFRRFITDITEEYCASFAKIEEKFGFRHGNYSWKQCEKKEGVAHLRDENGKTHYAIVALNSPMNRIKGAFEENPAYGLFDEFVVDQRIGEKYLKGEAFRFKEAFKTFYRESGGMKMYLLGNPYSFYNPYFVAYGVDPKKLATQRLLIGSNWAAQYHDLSPELKAWLKDNDPQYADESDPYFQYAFNGVAINDGNIKVVDKQPQGFALRFFLTVEGKTMAIYQNSDWGGQFEYWVGYQGSARNADAFAFDFSDLSDGSVLYSREENWAISRFARAVRMKKVAFASLECDYLIEEIYPTL